MTSKLSKLLNNDYSDNIFIQQSTIVNFKTEDDPNYIASCPVRLTDILNLFTIIILLYNYYFKVGNGLFSKRNIEKGSVICLYAGRLIDENEG